jgi:acetyltransferase-like isoleucine patch superfamily enzyme
MKFNNTNVHIGQNVSIGQNVKIGDNTTIYDNVIIEDEVIICDNCVIGEPIYSYYKDVNYENPVTIIGKQSLIRSYTIIYANSKLGMGCQTGHRVTIRENSEIGLFCSIGSYNDIQGYCLIGDYCRFQSFVNIGQGSKIGDYVFIYPYTVLTNDPTPPSNQTMGVAIGSYSQIAAGTTMLPATRIGEHSLVGAGSVVGGNYSDDSFIHGSPAKRVGQLSKMPFFNEKGKRHYPWPFFYERGMPWQGINFKDWKKN